LGRFLLNVSGAVDDLTNNDSEVAVINPEDPDEAEKTL
jgi:hypothetical protein